MNAIWEMRETKWGLKDARWSLYDEIMTPKLGWMQVVLCKDETYVMPSTFRITSCHVSQVLNVLDPRLKKFDQELQHFDNV